MIGTWAGVSGTVGFILGVIVGFTLRHDSWGRLPLRRRP
jgi:hypothetical protein